MDLEIRVALVEQQLRFEKEIREEQAKEYARRLDELNHAHAEAVRVQNTYVSEEVYDRDHRETRERIEKIERFDSEQQGRYAMIAVALTIGSAILAVSVNVIIRMLTAT